MYSSFVSLGKFIPIYLILFIAKVNGIDSLISLSGFSSKEQVSFNFMAAVTVCNDFGAQEKNLSLLLLFSLLGGIRGGLMES